MIQENFFNKIVSNTYSFFLDGTFAVLDSLKVFSKSLAEVQLLESKYIERITNISSLIEIQRSEIEYLEKHGKTNEVISMEIEKINRDLEKLTKHREDLQKELDKLRVLEGDFEKEDQAVDQVSAFKRDLKGLVASNKLDTAIEQLQACLDDECNAQDDLVLFSARLASINKQRSLGLISIVEHGNLHSNLIHGFLHLINEIEEQDLNL